MIAIILAVLGVPLWLVVGAFGGALWSRRRFLARPGVFRLKQLDDGSWPRRPAFGQLVHDVLVVNTGMALVRTTVSGIAAVSTVDATDTPPPEGFDAVFRVLLDDGSTAVLAVEATSTTGWQGLHAPTGNDR